MEGASGSPLISSLQLIACTYTGEMVLEETQIYGGVGVMVSVLVFCSGSLIANQPLPNSKISRCPMPGRLQFSEIMARTPLASSPTCPSHYCYLPHVPNSQNVRKNREKAWRVYNVGHIP